MTLSLKSAGVAPGDISASQLEALADLAERYTFGEVRTSQQQNIVLADVRVDDLYPLWLAAKGHGFADANIGTLTDITCCPGGDFCYLANARSIPLAAAIQRHFDDMRYVYDLGELSLKISGCMNACAHHNISQIGILGVDKKGQEFYQIMLGGSSGDGGAAAVGRVLGPAFSALQIPRVLEKILNLYLDQRAVGEHFSQLVNRLGMAAFKAVAYATADPSAQVVPPGKSL